MLADPYADLRTIVPELQYKPGWRFDLRSGPSFSSSATADHRQTGGNVATSGGWTITWPAEPLWFLITLRSPDSGASDRELDFTHTFHVPPLDRPRAFWRRWLLDRILDVERHEACEFFQLDGRRPFFPEHGPDANLYGISDRT